MVRVNLLPEKRQTKTRGAATEPGQLWLIAVFALLVLEIVGLMFVQKSKQDDLQKAIGDNATKQSQIDAIKRGMLDHPQIKQQLQDLRDRKTAIDKLQAGRTGPTATLEELSHILTSGRGPTHSKDDMEQMRHDNPTAVANTNWDPHRVWLTSYQELERTVKMAGLAKDPEDVSEFERRLILSDYFYDVSLLPGGKITDNATKQELVRFELAAKVRY
jgi:type IV pilus assembly protein PilN